MTDQRPRPTLPAIRVGSPDVPKKPASYPGWESHDHDGSEPGLPCVCSCLLLILGVAFLVWIALGLHRIATVPEASFVALLPYIVAVAWVIGTLMVGYNSCYATSCTKEPVWRR
jgi:hypothetical protein